jgi:cytosine/adenosine deaminase-related metal-dependent hydrolase
VIEAIGPAAGRLSATEHLDARGGIVLASFVEPHIHLDKVLTRQLRGANVATWDEAEAVRPIRFHPGGCRYR